MQACGYDTCAGKIMQHIPLPNYAQKWKQTQNSTFAWSTKVSNPLGRLNLPKWGRVLLNQPLTTVIPRKMSNTST